MEKRRNDLRRTADGFNKGQFIVVEISSSSSKIFLGLKKYFHEDFSMRIWRMMIFGKFSNTFLNGQFNGFLKIRSGFNFFGFYDFHCQSLR